MSTWAVLVAAGKGERAGFRENKVFHPVDGRCSILRSLDKLKESAVFDGVVVVLSKQDEENFRELMLQETDFGIVIKTAEGGKTRQRSVYNGLRSVCSDCEVVAVHDAARPFVAVDILRKSVEEARKFGSAVISTPVVDTVFIMEKETAVPLERTKLRAVQTPQTFSLRELLFAHESAEKDEVSASDDASLYAKYCGKVHLFTTDDATKNIKLTMKEDFIRNSTLPSFRIGSGYDVHRLVEGRKLILCGEDIPFEKGLLGHSDADVATHALMDAILGALALGDIGRHFPDSDEKYRGIDSMLLLEHVVSLMLENGYTMQNCDVTIVAQRPKLAPYIEKMRQNLANALRVDVSAVNVKATTTERMGFEGEGLGISAQAVVLLKKQEV